MAEATPPDLKELIVRRIVAEGPIPFEAFMEMALYHPGLGFFATDRLRSVMAGDFLTSPEVSSLFGEALAVFVDAERGRIGDPFTLVEAGAGSGSLLHPLLARTSVDTVPSTHHQRPVAHWRSCSPVPW